MNIAIKGAVATRPYSRQFGFTLIEVMIVVALIAILTAIALPSYQNYVQRASREAVQAQLIEMASIQDKIFLNDNAYTTNVTGAYNGKAVGPPVGGLGQSATSRDLKYRFSATVAGASFVITATPEPGTTQAGTGTLTINSEGQRAWNAATGTVSW